MRFEEGSWNTRQEQHPQNEPLAKRGELHSSAIKIVLKSEMAFKEGHSAFIFHWLVVDWRRF